MAENSEKTLIFESEFIPYINEAKGYAQDFLITSGGQKNRNYVQEYVDFQNIPLWMQEILLDPQTSGGLLFSVKKECVKEMMEEFESKKIKAHIVGSVADKKNKFIIVR